MSGNGNRYNVGNWIKSKKKREDPLNSKIDELEESVDILKKLRHSLFKTTEDNL